VGGKSAENPGGGENVKTRQRDGQQRKNAAKRKYCGTISFFFLLSHVFLSVYFLLIFFISSFLSAFQGDTKTHSHFQSFVACGPKF